MADSIQIVQPTPGEIEPQAPSTPAPETQGVSTPVPSTGTPATPPKLSATPTTEPQTADRPSWLPPEFKTPEEFVQAYNKVKPQTQPQTTPKPDQQPQTPPPSAVEKYAQEFAQNGKLSDESYADLEKQGISRAMVNAHIAGIQALQQQKLDTFYGRAGGKEQYDKIAEWSKTGLSKEDRDAFNRTLDTNDDAQISLALDALVAKYNAQFGTEPKLVNGTAPSAGNPFKSIAEMTAAMRDPRYTKDPAYRAEVEHRLEISNIL